ncbi:MAG: MATE family efflux transporter [Clostridiales bacterium]|nr:MATE family efflux transporter [Clostridiales bacterium]
MSKQLDMTTGPLGGKIIRYTIPLALTGILQQLFNAADVAVVGRFSGKEAMAAVGSNAPVIGLLVNLFVGISLGSNVVIARAIGQGNNSKASKAVHTSLVVAFLGGLLLTLIGELLAPQVVDLLDVPSDVKAMSVKYLRIYLLGMPVILLYNFQSAIFRSCGNTGIPLMALVISGVLNVGLNLMFVVGLGMDVEGVAIATVIANAISSAILFATLLRTDSVVRVNIKNIRIDPQVLSGILIIGVPAGVQGMVFSFANIIVQSAVNSLGTIVVAGSAAAFNLEIFAYYVMNSFGQTCSTFVGQNYGAGKNDRCRKVLKNCLVQNLLTTGTICCVILLLCEPLLRIFNSDPDVISNGRIRLQFIFAAYSVSFIQETLTGYLRGFGISFVPAICSVVGICGVRLTWIFFVFPHHRSFTAIMAVYPLSLGITALVILVMTLIVKPSERYKVG